MKLISTSSRVSPKGLHLLLCVLIATSVLISAGCKSQYPSASAQQNRSSSGGGGGDEKSGPKQVKVARVEEMQIGNAVSVMGALAAQERATLSFKVPGRVRSITVDLGSSVRQGQIIAEVEPQDYQIRVQQAEAALAQARARLGLPTEGTDDKVDPEQTGTVRQARAVMEEARATRNRVVTLVEQGVAPRAEYDEADAAYKVAVSRYQDAIEEIRNRQAVLAQRRTEVALARQQLIGTNIVAPFDGIVEERIVSIGEFINTGTPVVRIVKINPLRFRAEVPERDAPSVRSGQTVRVTVEGDTTVHTGRIVRLSPSIAEQNRILIVEAEIQNKGYLRPGSFARAEILTGETTMAAGIPSSALITFAGIEKVIAVENGKAREKPITTGRRIGDQVEVVAGLNVGETVVLNPGNLQSGQAVSVSE